MAMLCFQGFHKHDGASRLSAVEFQIQRHDDFMTRGGANGVTVKVTPLVRDIAPSVLDGGLNVVVVHNFDGL